MLTSSSAAQANINRNAKFKYGVAFMPHYADVAGAPQNSIIGGASALLFSDVVARVVLAPQEIHVGIITSLVGAPFFLWVLRTAKNQGYW